MDQLPQESSKQPDPQPPVSVASKAPSLLLYFVLTAIAVALIVMAFKLNNRPDWPGLFLGLATNIIAAVILLIIIDRRLRESELLAIREYAAGTPVKLAALFSKNISIAILYSQTLHKELLLIRPKPYFERKHPSVDYLLGESAKGFILIGQGGMGKSVLLQMLALKQTERVVLRPLRELIPIILPMREWKLNAHLNDQSLTEQLWGTMNRYTPISQERFAHWLVRRRLLIILDGLDEIGIDFLVALRQIEEIRRLYMNIPVIISTRTLSPDLGDSKLPKIEIPPMTHEEGKTIRDFYFTK